MPVPSQGHYGRITYIMMITRQTNLFEKHIQNIFISTVNEANMYKDALKLRSALKTVEGGKKVPSTEKVFEKVLN